MRTLFAAAALAAFALPLASCSDGAGDAAPAEEANPTGLVAANARLMLPPVAGNPAAVYFDLTNDGQRSIAVRRADVADAGRAVMHDVMAEGQAMSMAEMGPLAVPAGQTIKFEPGGKHIMVYDLSPEITAGGRTEVTLTVAGGDKLSFEVPVQAAGAER